MEQFIKQKRRLKSVNKIRDIVLAIVLLSTLFFNWPIFLFIAMLAALILTIDVSNFLTTLKWHYE